MKNIVFCLPRPCRRALLGSPGAALGRLGGPGLSGGPLGSLWGPSWGSPVRLLGLSWAVWGPSGAVLVLSWGPLGPSSGPLWGHWGCPGAHFVALLVVMCRWKTENARTRKTIEKPMKITVFGLPRPLQGDPGRPLEPSWSPRGRSGGHLGPLFSHLGLSWLASGSQEGI